MSVASEINRIKSNIADAYDEAESKGATMPATENSANLAQTVASIPEAVQPTLITKQITENGPYTAADDNADGYSEVTVDVPDESKDILNSLIDRSITTITSNATSIGEYAFYNYTSLTEAYFSEVRNIGANAFYGCTSLTKAYFSEVRNIGYAAFYGCKALTEANFPKVGNIGTNAFRDCTSLTEAYFSEATSIGYAAFYGCKALTEANFPKVGNIGPNAFQSCTAIKYFDMSEVDGVPRISTTTFNSTTCIFLFRDQTQLDTYASATNWSALADRFQIKEATP